MQYPTYLVGCDEVEQFKIKTFVLSENITDRDKGLKFQISWV